MTLSNNQEQDMPLWKGERVPSLLTALVKAGASCSKLAQDYKHQRPRSSRHPVCCMQMSTEADKASLLLCHRRSAWNMPARCCTQPKTAERALGYMPLGSVIAPLPCCSLLLPVLHTRWVIRHIWWDF